MNRQPATSRPPLPGIPAALAADPSISPYAKLTYAAVLSGVGSNGLCLVPLPELRARVAATDRCFRLSLQHLTDAGWLTPMPYPGKVTAWIVNATAAPHATVTESDDPGMPCHGSESETALSLSDPWPSDRSESTTAAPHADPPRARAAAATQTPIKNSIQAASSSSRLASHPARASPERKRQPLPENWTPSAATLAKAAEERPDLSPADFRRVAGRLTRKFAGTGQLEADWEAKFLDWVGWEEIRSPAAGAAAPDGARADAAAVRAPVTKSGRRMMELGGR